MRFIATWTSATLLATRDLTPGIREFLLRPDGFSGSPYPIGSHIDVGVTIDGQPQTRSYSLIGEIDPQGYRIAVRRAPDSRGGSHYMWSLAPGARLNITLPASLVQLDWTRRQFCLIAGGIGVTPIVGAAQALASRCTMPCARAATPPISTCSKVCSATGSWFMPATRAGGSTSTVCWPPCRAIP
jgi:vanillate O-demethylase ferredoxin subunit